MLENDSFISYPEVFLKEVPWPLVGHLDWCNRGIPQQVMDRQISLLDQVGVSGSISWYFSHLIDNLLWILIRNAYIISHGTCLEVRHGVFISYSYFNLHTLTLCHNSKLGSIIFNFGETMIFFLFLYINKIHNIQTTCVL